MIFTQNTQKASEHRDTFVNHGFPIENSRHLNASQACKLACDPQVPRTKGAHYDLKCGTEHDRQPRRAVNRASGLWCQAPGYLHAWHEGVSLPTTTRWPGVGEEKKKGFGFRGPLSSSAEHPRIARGLEPAATGAFAKGRRELAIQLPQGV